MTLAGHIVVRTVLVLIETFKVGTVEESVDVSSEGISLMFYTFAEKLN